MLQNQQLLKTIFECSIQIKRYETLDEYIERLVEALQNIVDIKNFSIVVQKNNSSTLNYLFYADEKNKQLKTGDECHLSAISDCALAWIHQHKQNLIYPHNNRDYQPAGARPKQVCGFILKNQDNQYLGTLMVKSYRSPRYYNIDQQQLLQLIANLVSDRLNTYSKEEHLKAQIIKNDTVLASKLDKSGKAEKLQRAIFKIASIATRHISLQQFYEQIHKVLGTLMDTSHIGILLHDKKLKVLKYAYWQSDQDDKMQGKALPYGPGFSSYIIRERKAVLLTPQIVNEKVKSGEITGLIGNQHFNYWIGAALISEEKVLGAILLQSYDPQIIFTDADVRLLQFIASHIATALAVYNKQQLNTKDQKKLIKQHKILELQNIKINHSLSLLHKTEQELVSKQKISSLGLLVGSVAKELKSPLKDCADSLVQLQRVNQSFAHKYKKQKLSENFIKENITQTLNLEAAIEHKMKAAAALINSFKKISVEVRPKDWVQVNLKNIIKRILLHMRPELDKTNASVEFECDDEIILILDTKALSRIIQSLIQNSSEHAFLATSKNCVKLAVSIIDEDVVIKYSDNGLGMSEQELEQIFIPFFSNKEVAGSGLGCNLIYNLATSSLQGSINVSCPDSSGLSYKITFPLVTKHKQSASLGIL